MVYEGQAKGNHSIMGMDEFNLMHFHTRQEICDFVCVKYIKVRVSFLDMDFLDVSINGQRKGIYLLERDLIK